MVLILLGFENCKKRVRITLKSFVLDEVCNNDSGIIEGDYTDVNTYCPE
jgi:hypothetical protein